MDDSIIGTSVDGYRIQEVLGRGGMGVVYRARDVSLARDVALKRISPKLANDEPFLRRFRSEAQALARLESPHIVSVYALRETEIGLLIVMEYVEGGTLKDLIRQGPMDWQEALPFIEHMLTGLGHAHGAEVIHRDIKPRNILLTPNGTVKITDFGLAKVYRADANQTVTQGVHGTLKYMSPEQVEGRSDLDHRSDLYSLGMTVYEMLAGQLPFDDDASEFAIMQTIVEEAVPPPDQYRSEIPDAVASVVMKSLAKKPEDRFSDAEAMREALQAAATDQEETTEATTRDVVQAAGIASDGLSRVRVAGVGLVVSVMVLAGYLMYAMMLSGAESNRQAASDPQPAVSTTALAIHTSPTGATVYHDGRRVGLTPLDHAVDEDSVQLRVRKAGFLPVDTTLGLERRERVDLRVELQEENAPPVLTIATEPSGAAVYAEGERLGTTPLDYPVEDDVPPLRVQKDGFAPLDTIPRLRGAGPHRLDLQLLEASADRATTARGAVDLGVRPSGMVIVDGERHEGGASVDLPVGRHRVLFRHPEYGEKDTTITVQEGETVLLTCYFEHVIRVRSPEGRGTVVFGGTNTEASPPYERSRGPGVYRVGLRLPDDPPGTVTGGVYRKTAAGREIERNEFSGAGKEVTVAPSFSRATHVVTFRVQSLAEQIRGRTDGLKEAMKRAIEEQRWELLPDRLAQSCQDALDALYDKHEITSARVVANEVRRVDGRVELPFEAYITYRQRGREGTKFIPLAVETVWGIRGDGAQLVEVRRTDVGSGS